MLVSDNTKQAEGLGNLLESIGKTSADAFEEKTTNLMKKLGRAPDIEIIIDTATVSKYLQEASATISEVTNFCQTGEEKIRIILLIQT